MTSRQKDPKEARAEKAMPIPRDPWREALDDPGFRRRLEDATRGMADGKVTPYSEIRRRR